MAANTAISINGVSIRLSDERWVHIVESHDDLAGRYYDILEAISQPSCVVKGTEEALIALSTEPDGKFLVVVYRESSQNDGFVLTAYRTSKRDKMLRRQIVWPK